MKSCFYVGLSTSLENLEELKSIKKTIKTTDRVKNKENDISVMKKILVRNIAILN